MSAATDQKAARLLAEGRVEPDPNPVRMFRTEGDHGTYIQFVSAPFRSCTCPHGREGAEGDCSHLKAAIEWVYAEAALKTETAANNLQPAFCPEPPLSARALAFPRYLEALTARKAQRRAEGEAAFARLGA